MIDFSFDKIMKKFREKGYETHLLLPEGKDWNEQLFSERTQVQEENFSQGVAEQGGYVMNSM